MWAPGRALLSHTSSAIRGHPSLGRGVTRRSIRRPQRAEYPFSRASWPSSSHPSCARSSRETALRGRLVHGRQTRPLVARGRERRGEDHAPAVRRGRDVDSGRQARVREGTRVALHDSARRCELRLTLREYALAARATCSRSRTSSAARAGDGEGAHDDATLRRYAEAQARLEHAGGMGWRDARTAAVRGLGFARTTSTGPRHLLRRRADARVACARARGEPRPASPRRADEPPRRRNLEWLERELERSTRR
jgi:hypothetical protein